MGPRSVLRLCALALLLVLPLVPPGRAAAQDTQEGVPETESVGRAPDGAPVPNGVTAYGAAAHHGPDGGMDLMAPVVAIAATGDGGGYWLGAGDGGVFTFGDADFHGSAGDIALNRPIVGMAAEPGGDGYWMVASDGGIFSYGAAAFHGSTGDMTLNRPVVGMAATPSGNGYWLVADDGGIFSFGDADFHGSTGAMDLDSPVAGMAATSSGDGYWLVAEDGGVFSFGDAEFRGSAADERLERPVVDIAASADGDGYWISTDEGQVFEFGVDDHGSATEIDDDPARAVGIAPHPDGGYWIAHSELAVLEVEDEGPQVEALQRRLRDLGYWVGPVDGVYGELTEQAVYAFQKYEGLPIDGVAGEATRGALERAVRPRPSSESGDLVEIDKSRQLLFVVRDGATLWVFNTATGDEEPYTYEGQTYDAETPTGRFTIFRQIDGWRTSHLGRLYRPKYFTTTGIAVHGYSRVPPRPASHGCVRVTNAAMDHIWADGLMPIGTNVWVYGSIPT